MDIQRPEGASTVWHGSYGEWTHYDIVQHRYGCTDCEAEHQGYVEILEIKNAPPWRSKYVIHEYWNATGSNVYEFESLEAALSAYPKWLGTSQTPKDIPEFGGTGYIRSLYYGAKGHSSGASTNIPRHVSVNSACNSATKSSSIGYSGGSLEASYGGPLFYERNFAAL